jgi:hypothetical protein
MPFPALLGLPALGVFLGGVFSGIVGFLATYLTKKVAITLAVLTVITGLTVAFMATIHGLVAGVTYYTPDALNMAVSWFVPDNAIPCVSAVWSARIFRWVYEWKIRIIQYKLL